MTTTSTQTYVIYSKGIASVDLGELHAKITPGMQIFEGIVTSVKSCAASQTEKTSYLKCLTIALRILSDEDLAEIRAEELCENFGEDFREAAKTVEDARDNQDKPKRGRKTTRVKLSGKALSIKIFKNGSTQVTGCKSIDHAKLSMRIVYDLFNVDRVDELTLVSVMINVNFDMGFKINKERLGEYFTVHGINVPPLTSGYMGIKIRIPLLIDSSELLIPKMSWTKSEGFTDAGTVPYVSFFANDSQKKNKIFTACIGVFHNGKVLMSCINDQAILVMSEWIKGFLIEARDSIEMKPKVIKTFRR